MSKKKKGKDRQGKQQPQLKPKQNGERASYLHTETKNSIWAVGMIGAGVIFILSGIAKAGPAGEFIFTIFDDLLGWGYFMLPLSLFLVAGVLLISGRREMVGMKLIGAGFLILSALGLIDVAALGQGGLLGKVLGSIQVPFGRTGASIIDGVILVISLLVVVNTPLKVPERFKKQERAEEEKRPQDNVVIKEAAAAPAVYQPKEKPEGAKKKEEIAAEEKHDPEEELTVTLGDAGPKRKATHVKLPDYVTPPLTLLKSATEKPTTGDLRANANIIKRTLESFGVTVEMGEINIGPKVTRYTLKPAEGVKLARIVALNQDLALALAAHPIRIEAPIPGKSLVGIEVPNKMAAMVRLGSLMTYPEFQNSGPLGISMGRDVNGEPIFSNIAKMPHMLIAGATGSGKSIFVHSLIVSLLYKNSPAMLKMAMVDPKRVELSMYNGLPHLITPVITENKKAMGVFRWAISEMERRYELFSAEGRRDIQSYNDKNPDDQLPYVVIVIDELADLMSTYGREVEGAIIRLAQMARATGIHLILATQRPSVEVITGLIKANITNRVAMQVASQIDSRTILDTSGAEKLLGGGDLLFISQELSKPKRIQGAYLGEEEISKVVDFIKENNKPIIEAGSQLDFSQQEGPAGNPASDMLDDYLEDGSDELYDEAVATIAAAKKASASLLQRRLKVGYARAARLLDLMEQDGLIGPGEGAKPREVYQERIEQRLEG